MKICVLGLDGVAPEILADERLANIRRLMEVGLYGTLEGDAPVDFTAEWTCMATSHAPATLTPSTSAEALAIWDCLDDAGKKSILIGVPPSYPTRRINGISVGGLIVRGADASQTTHDFARPPEIQSKLSELLGEYPIDVDGLAGANSAASPDELRDEIITLSGKPWLAARSLLSEQPWDYFQIVDTGVELASRLSQGRAQNDRGNLTQDFFVALDEQIGSVLELLDDQTIVLVVATPSAAASSPGDPMPTGAFVLAAPNCPLSGEYHGARLVDLAPTLLDLAGYSIPQSMQGRSLVADLQKKKDNGRSSSQDDEKLLMGRLSGLGYV